MEFHNGNTMLGGPAIDKLSLRRLADLSLDIDFDMYATGNFLGKGDTSPNLFYIFIKRLPYLLSTRFTLILLTLIPDECT